MGELRQEFLQQAIFNIQTLQQESSVEESFSEDFVRRYFRLLHTVKGTSNTFNLNYLARLAHEIETLLQAIQNNQITHSAKTKTLCRESFRHLSNMMTDYKLNLQVVFPQEFTDEIKNLIPEYQPISAQDFLAAKIPNSVLAQLATPEKNNLQNAVKNEKNFYSLRADFDAASFYEGFKYLKSSLDQHGETIAISSPPDKAFAFQIFFVSNLSRTEIENHLKPFAAVIEFAIDFKVKNYADNLDGVTSCLCDIGAKIASRLDKKIVFTRVYDDFAVNSGNLILLKGIASQLIYNAVDHAIETAEERSKNGKNPLASVKISVKKSENRLLLEITDDGKGIDLEKVTKRAKEKGLIPLNQTLGEAQAIELIFTQGFSTSETVSEISGRGVGLDAVKDLVESSGGKIEVETKTGRGTKFSIWLKNG